MSNAPRRHTQDHRESPQGVGRGHFQARDGSGSQARMGDTGGSGPGRVHSCPAQAGGSRARDPSSSTEASSSTSTWGDECSCSQARSSAGERLIGQGSPGGQGATSAGVGGSGRTGNRQATGANEYRSSPTFLTRGECSDQGSIEGRGT